MNIEYSLVPLQSLYITQVRAESADRLFLWPVNPHATYIYILACPKKWSTFYFVCAQGFSVAYMHKNEVCKVLALKIHFCDCTSHLKFEILAFLGQKYRFSRCLCSHSFEDRRVPFLSDCHLM